MASIYCGEDDRRGSCHKGRTLHDNIVPLVLLSRRTFPPLLVCFGNFNARNLYLVCKVIILVFLRWCLRVVVQFRLFVRRKIVRH